MNRRLAAFILAVAACFALSGSVVEPKQEAAPARRKEHVLRRHLTPGLNAVELPCAREGIDLESLHIVCSKAPGDVRIIGLVVPRERPLHWRVFSPVSGEAEFRITFVRRDRP
jgi:hypothetical protein